MKPIIFSTLMVQAILDGRKTQTRRAIRYDFESIYSAASQQGIMDKVCQYGELPSDAIEWYAKNIAKAKYQPGDVLWVRETWYYEYHMHDLTAGKPNLPSGKYSHRYIYKADWPDYPVGDGWKPSIHMPREAARLFLLVKNVQVERVQDITEEDVLAEGIDGWMPTLNDPDSGGEPVLRAGYQALWDSLNAKHGYGWDVNPWVWVVEFERVEGVK